MEQYILPGDIYAFFTRARAHTYAADMTPEPNPLLPGAHELHYHPDGSPYAYCDRYFDNSARPGNFFGIEIVRRDSADGDPIAVCSYGGSLTRYGLSIDDGTLGKVLKQVLKNHAHEVRFGNSVMVALTLADIKWRYEDEGQIEPWGWGGRERIYRDDIIVYELVYSGGSFSPGY